MVKNFGGCSRYFSDNESEQIKKQISVEILGMS